MNESNFIGALSSSLAASCFILGFALYFGLLADYGYPSLEADLASQVTFMLEHRRLLYVWYLVIYLLFGLCLVALVTVLYQRLKSDAILLSQLASALGLIWAGLVIACGMSAGVGIEYVRAVYSQSPDQAQSLWLSLQMLLDGLGGGNEIVGGLWLILVSLAACRQDSLPRQLSVMGLIVGVAGILTMVPQLEVMAAVFGFGCIAWFGGLSVVLLNDRVED